MPTQQRAENEVRILSRNAKEGVRFVTFVWAFRHVIVPLLAFFALLIVAAGFQNGPLAALLSAVVFAVPIFLIWAISTRQFTKIAQYWRK